MADAPIALRHAGRALFFALLTLVVLWEGWFAAAGIVPRPIWLALKVAPLAAVLYPLWRGSARAHLIAALVVLLYLIEAVVLGYGALKGLEPTATLVYAAMEFVLTTAFFCCAALYARRSAEASAVSARAETGS